MSEVRPLALVGGGPGRRAALVGPRGEEEEDMVGALGLVGGMEGGLFGTSGVDGCEEFVEDASELASEGS
jgi:hypothetical protein